MFTSQRFKAKKFYLSHAFRLLSLPCAILTQGSRKPPLNGTRSLLILLLNVLYTCHCILYIPQLFLTVFTNFQLCRVKK
jgi:hypothetical protein